MKHKKEDKGDITNDVTKGGLGENEEDSDEEIFDLSKPHISRDEIKNILSTGLPKGSFMRPKNLEFYRRSLVHKSLQKSVRHSIYNKRPVQPYMIESNERIEFLGDAVLNLVAANVLYDKYPDKDEGFMTRMRTKIVRDKQCARFAKVLGLQNHILTGNKVVRVKDSDGKITNGKLLEDAFESFIGAIYKDLGFNSAESFILRLINNHVDFSSLLIDDNYKDILMRYSQAFGYELPVYETISSDGPPHNRKFVVSLSLYRKGEDISTKREFGLGEGSSKKAASQAAGKACICNCRAPKCKKIHSKELEGIIDRDH